MYMHVDNTIQLVPFTLFIKIPSLSRKSSYGPRSNNCLIIRNFSSSSCFFLIISTSSINIVGNRLKALTCFSWAPDQCTILYENSSKDNAHRAILEVKSFFISVLCTASQSVTIVNDNPSRYTSNFCSAPTIVKISSSYEW